MTAADWLRRAADARSEADATQDQEVRRVKVVLASVGFGCCASLCRGRTNGPTYPFGLSFSAGGQSHVPWVAL